MVGTDGDTFGSSDLVEGLLVVAESADGDAVCCAVDVDLGAPKLKLFGADKEKSALA